MLQSGSTMAPPTIHSSTLHLDLSGVGSDRLRQELRETIQAHSGVRVREREGAWIEGSSWVLDGSSTEGISVLLFGDLATVADAIRPGTSSRWAVASRKRLFRVVALVEPKPTGPHVARLEGILRSLHGRLSLVPYPRFTPLSRRWSGCRECVSSALGLLNEDALLDVWAVPGTDRLLLRFGDDTVGSVSLTQLGLTADRLLLESAAPGPGGRTLRVLTPGASPEDGFSLDSEILRTLVDEPEGQARKGSAPRARREVPVGLRVRTARIQRGLSQRELGRRIDMGQAVISNLERGVHSPRIRTLKRIADGLELSLTQLLAFEPTEDSTGA